MREIEIKLEADPNLDIRSLGDAGYVLDALPDLSLTATYYDTSDLKLARWGATLRYRKGDEGGDRWTLKLPAEGGREERDIEGRAGQVPAEAKNLVTAFTRGKELQPVATLRTKRRRWMARMEENASAIAEVAIDDVAVLRGRRIAERFRELELEAKETDSIGLAKLANALRKLGAQDRDQRPKVVRALGDAAIQEPDVPQPPEVKASAPAEDAIQAAVARNARRLILNDPLTRLGLPEGLHQMRVASRRIRSDLKTFGSLVDEQWTADLDHDLRWIAGVLGKVRDLDVMIERLHASAKELDGDLGPLFEALVEKQRTARKTATTALRSKRYVALVERLVGAAAAPQTTDEAKAPSSEILTPLVATRWRKLAGTAQATRSDTSDEVLHDIRIRAKKTRYAAEAVAPAVGKKIGKELSAFAEKVASLQDTLGAHQDAVVAMATIKEIVEQHPTVTEFVFAAGQLFERETQAAKTSRKDTQIAWGKLDRKKNLGWLTT